ncbi:hypothetical protein BUALT_Bualt17G0061200 [Buddleja alternifolia]|uniref:Homeobox-leucine zipper protein n=1 Tax=Buddleja alternifolia TaxID=168488 RepID=A0AAV6WCU4_9LAMI|nr:hypothetical protein BUALT_Bualt17G0061200 [Buddleja alternifolia]
MEGGSVDDDSRMINVLLKDETIPCNSEVLDSLWVPNSPPPFHDSASMVNFENIRGENNTESPCFNTKMANYNNEFDECLHQPEKKRRLGEDQVKFLEKSFEVENKLEPQRKLQLAKELGLQPRQIAIWFQNRRARYKTKILEKEYDSLKASYDRLRANYETLCKENEEMKNEVNFLAEKLFTRENTNPCDPFSSISDSHQKKSNFSSNASAKSDVFDNSGSPHYDYTEGNDHTALLDLTADSSRVFESDCSQGEDERLFPKLEVESFDDLQPNSCNLGFLVQDQGTWLWQ